MGSKHKRKPAARPEPPAEGGHAPRDDRRAETEAAALDGLRRLALCPVNDAVTLLTEEDPPGPITLKNLDLFCVSELKRSKAGVELRFYDRFKALEALLAWSREGVGAEGEGSLYAALERSAAALEKGEKPKDDS